MPIHKSLKIPPFICEQYAAEFSKSKHFLLLRTHLAGSTVLLYMVPHRGVLSVAWRKTKYITAILKYSNKNFLNECLTFYYELLCSGCDWLAVEGIP